MLTVITTLNSQRRNVLEFLTQAVSAKRQGQRTPSLLPQVPAAAEESKMLLKTHEFIQFDFSN